MTFRNKILFSIWAVVLSLLVITFFILNYWIRERMRETFSGELQTGFSTVKVHEELQSSQLVRACTVISESPRLRAVAELGDERTASQLVQELEKTTVNSIMVLTDAQGKPLVQTFNGKKDRWDISDSHTIMSALHSVPAAEVSSIRGGFFRVVSVPILIGTEIVGTLTMGFEITVDDLIALKHATNCDLMIISQGGTFLAALDSADAGSLVSAIRSIQPSPMNATIDSGHATFPFRADGEEYLGRIYRLNRQDETDSIGVSYIILKPLSREVRQAMASILGTFGVVSVLFLALTTVIGIVISRSITRPISELVRGTTEIEKGNYDNVIKVRGRDELGILARRFMAMSSSLKEKISELGKLNRDLIERNKDLDETLRKLQSAQAELILSERLAATGRMTAQLAHEINNPIHNIQSCLNTALNRLSPDTKGKDLIELAYDEVGRLSRLAGQMLNMYRSSLVDEEMRPTNLHDLLQEVIALVQDELSASGISIHATIQNHLPAIRGSKDKLKQVLLNLVANARDALPRGGNLTFLASADGSTARVTVQDDGIGIPKENLNRIFDAFFTTKSKMSGVGLGLSICYSIVRQHGGTMTVESSPGEGTRFTMLLPIQVSTTNPEIPS
jgi:signal transduction histidine kinase